MQFTNTNARWGLISVLVHWVSALIIIALFALGLYITGLDYYDPWYHQAPGIHKSAGILFFVLTLFRIAWLSVSRRPHPVLDQRNRHAVIAIWVHRILYLLLFLVMISGYLISTANGDPIPVFDWFNLASMVSGGEKQADIAGDLHFLFAVTLILLATVHTLAALKHHFIDNDEILTRMLGIKRRRSKS